MPAPTLRRGPIQRRLVLLALPPVDELDLVGPMEVFGTANRLLGGGRMPYVVELVTTAKDRKIDGESGLSLLAHAHYRDGTRRADSVLVICGVGARATRDRALLGWLKDIAASARRLGSVCVGAFVLAEAGLLDGRRATVHWRFAREFAQRYPRVAVDPRPTWLRDGNIYTSAGISAGIDLALAWVEQDFGAAAALKVARELVLFLRRPAGQEQVSVSLQTQAAQTTAMQALPVWMMEHIDRPLPIDALARRVAMSPRNFARVFAQELGTTPARYLRQLRVEGARRLLELTDKSVSEVARACGLGSADVMARAFRAAVGTTPLGYRRHFRTPAAGSPMAPDARRASLLVARRQIATAARVAMSSERQRRPRWVMSAGAAEPPDDDLGRLVTRSRNPRVARADPRMPPRVGRRV